MAPVEGEDMRRTRLPLARHPEVAAWLLTVLDHLQAGKPIGEPLRARDVKYALTYPPPDCRRSPALIGIRSTQA